MSNPLGARLMDPIHNHGYISSLGCIDSPFKDIFPKTLEIRRLNEIMQELADTLNMPQFRPDGRIVQMATGHAMEARRKHPTLSLDECTAISLYTLEEDPREESAYFILNKTLRSLDRCGMQIWRDYIWLLLHALRKLPPLGELHVMRGVKGTLACPLLDLELGAEITWNAFTSTTTAVGVMDTFLGDEGPRAVVLLTLMYDIARNIADFSAYPDENEALLPPGICVQKKSQWVAGNGLVFVQMQQRPSTDFILPFSTTIVDLPRTSQRLPPAIAPRSRSPRRNAFWRSNGLWEQSWRYNGPWEQSWGYNCPSEQSWGCNGPWEQSHAGSSDRLLQQIAKIIGTRDVDLRDVHLRGKWIVNAKKSNTFEITLQMHRLDSARKELPVRILNCWEKQGKLIQNSFKNILASVKMSGDDLTLAFEYGDAVHGKLTIRADNRKVTGSFWSSTDNGSYALMIDS